jgi:hypothetical protein
MAGLAVKTIRRVKMENNKKQIFIADRGAALRERMETSTQYNGGEE